MVRGSCFEAAWKKAMAAFRKAQAKGQTELATFGAALIPETLRRTTLGTARVGDGVNLELDMMAKYVRNLVAPYLAGMRAG